MTRVAKAFLLIFISVVLLFTAASCSFFSVPIDENIKYIAHRGYTKNFPDNSVGAFLACSELDCWGVETDVKVTSDGVFVCLHDDITEFEGVELEVETSTYDELCAQPLKKNGDMVQYVCTFERYLQIIASAQKHAVIELKMVFTRAQLVQILDITRAQYDLANCTFIAFDIENLEILRELDGSLDMQYLASRSKKARLGIEKGFNISIKKNIATASLVKKAHDKGLQVGIWTINDPIFTRYASMVGADYITTDFYKKKD